MSDKNGMVLKQVIRVMRSLIRIALGLFFLWAAWGKWQQGALVGEPQTIYDRYISTPAVHHVIVIFEALLGLWLISSFQLVPSLFVAIGVLSFFSVVIGIELRSTTPRDCGCGIRPVITDPYGIIDALRKSLVTNLVAIGMCIWLWLTTPVVRRSPKQEA